MKEIHEPIQKLTNWECGDKIAHILEAIPEACWNSFEHGYQIPKNSNISEDKFTKAYLIFGIAGDDYSFCIFDRGIGFRGSFEYNHKDLFYSFLDSIKGRKKAEQECNIIEKAIGLGKSSSKK